MSRTNESESADLRGVAKVSLERSPGELLTPLSAIRSHCLGCCGRSPKETALCTITQCPLWPYRFGKRTRARMIVAEERLKPGLNKGWWAEWLETYTGQGYFQTEQAARAKEREE